MIKKRGIGDLNKVYRPCRIDEVVGHDTIKNILSNALEQKTLPHSLLFTGPSGCGKTTFARIIALGLNCRDGITPNPCCKCDSCRSILSLNSLAVTEIDAGRTGNVDTTRFVLDSLPAASLTNERSKVAIFDEAHLLGMGMAKSEEALLKVLEDTPEHVYIILCTNQSNKLKEVTRNRCKTIRFERLTDEDIYKLLEQICQFEGFEYDAGILKYIAAESSGVPRASLSFLQNIANEGSWTKKAAEIVINAGVDVEEIEIIDFCRDLLNSRSFKESVRKYTKIKRFPPETIRIVMCGFFVGCLKRAKQERDASKYSEIVEVLLTPYYNSPKPEHNLIQSLFKITALLRKSHV